MTVVKIKREQLLRVLDGFTAQVPTEVGLLEVYSEKDDPWTPLVPLSEERKLGIVRAHEVTGQVPPAEVWQNRIYEVFVYPMGDDGDDSPAPMMMNRANAMHLSIKRYDRAAVRNWRHFQQIKNEIAGEFREAVELFPSEHRIADNANQYHLWVMPEGAILPLGWPNGMVTITDEDVAQYNANGDPGRQEPMQEGLTVGKKMDEAQRTQVTGESEEARQRILGGQLAGRQPNRAARRRRK